MVGSWWGDFLLATIRAATPLIFCALGILLAERSGVLHIGVEGTMLAGALAAILGVVFSGSAWLGTLAAMVTGLLSGYVLALISVRLPTDQVVAGIAFNLASLGTTSFVFRLVAKKAQAIVPPIPAIGPEAWQNIPVVGFIFALSPFALAAIVLALILWVFLFKTGPGLLVRSAGENAHAAHAAGIDVLYVRTVALVIASVLSAVGGAALTIGWVRSFVDNITLGRGFIALAAVYFGRWHPLLALLACLVFGAGEALAFRAQAAGAGLNPHYYLMVPYILTLVAVGLAGRAHGPADAGKIYIRR